MIQYDVGKDINVFATKIRSLKIGKDVMLNLSLLAFIVVAVTFSGSGLMKHFGLLLLIFSILKGPQKLFKYAGKFPPEIVFLNYWVVWSAITGIIVSENQDLFINSLGTVFLLVGVINLIYILSSYNIKLLKIVLFGILTSAVLHFIAIRFGFQSDEIGENSRAVGFASNPNALGIRAVYSSLVLLFTMPIINPWKNKKMIFHIFLLVTFFSLILVSGSRKSFISFLFLIVGYLIILLVNRKYSFNLKRVFLLLLFFGLLIPTIVPFIIEGSLLEERFVQLSERGGVQGDIRYEMMTFGIELFSENPLFGVGLNNYRAHSPWGMYSHNDYIESLTNTGLPGFILYQLFSIIIILRSYKLLKISKLKRNRFYFGMIIIAVLTVKVVGIGQILFLQPAGMILLGVFASYSWIILKQLQNKLISL